MLLLLLLIFKTWLIVLQAEAARDRMKIKLAELNAEYSTTLETVNQSLDKDQINNLRNLQYHITALQV